ncbi:MAG TPA: alpha/beta hydrolase, partial [Stellaceae bacterium]|nr:alpha/beta hydrolase [Stellaceae bacterium]
MRSTLRWIGVGAGVAVLAALTALGFWAFDFADRHTRVLMPADLAMTAPGAVLPPKIAGLAGLWGGDRWDGGPQPLALAVERIDPDRSASVVYAWGYNFAAHTTQGWRRVTGKITEDDHLLFVLPNDHIADFSLGADGRLLGRDTDPQDWRSYILLRRPKGKDRAAELADATERSDPLWHEVDIPEHAEVGAAAGQTLTLRTTVYPGVVPGHQPLVIIVHGSTAGIDAQRSLRFEEQARYFLSLGYAVAVPMRKGRGNSGGPRLESDDFQVPPPRVQIDSGVEDIDAVIDYFIAQPSVDPSRIVLAGEEHGGLLSVVYAARHPGKISAVLNFSGGWWPETYRGGEINTGEFADAGGSVRTPTLWLYAEGDPFTPIPHVEEEFAAFRAAGGEARLALVPDPRDVKAYGTRLFQWTAKWEGVVRAFLAGDDRAPRRAGMTLVELKDPLDPEGTMDGAIFYPTWAAPGRAIAGPWVVNALRDAPPADGRFPLILLSPGEGGQRLSLHDLAAELARLGFIVATVTHPGDSDRDPDAWRSDRVLVGREYDLRSALDGVLADPVFGAHVDRDRIGVAGFSLGGYTALLLAGAKPDFSRFSTYCRDTAAPPATCAAGPPLIRQGLGYFRDERVKAAYLMAPGPGYFFTREGLSDVQIPVHIDDPAEDEMLARPFAAERIRDLLPEPPEYVRVPGAGHYAYLAPCPESMRERAPQLCTDPAGFDRAGFHLELATEMEEFYRRT